MDSLALQVVPNPNGAFPLTKYCSVLGTPGLTAFVGFHGLVNGKAVGIRHLHIFTGSTLSCNAGGNHLYILWRLRCWQVRFLCTLHT